MSESSQTLEHNLRERVKVIIRPFSGEDVGKPEARLRTDSQRVQNRLTTRLALLMTNLYFRSLVN
jgi:hypothetical protein